MSVLATASLVTLRRLVTSAPLGTAQPIVVIVRPVKMGSSLMALLPAFSVQPTAKTAIPALAAARVLLATSLATAAV